MKLVNIHKNNCDLSCFICNNWFRKDNYALDLRFVEKTVVTKVEYTDEAGKQKFLHMRNTLSSGKLILIHVTCLDELENLIKDYKTNQLTIDMAKVIAAKL